MRWFILAFTLAAAPAFASPEQDVLSRVNTARAVAKLPAVQLDAKLGKDCKEHTEYLRLNHGTAAIAGLAAHKQRDDLPGASAAGAACGKAADLFAGVADIGSAVDAWMAGIYHRRPILDPTLAKIALAYSTLPDGSYIVALMFVSAKDGKPSWPIAYPADGQKGVPMEYGDEIPNPIPNGGHGGYPVTLQFPPFDKVTNVKATLTTGDTALPIHLSDPAHPATSFSQGGMVSLIAKQPLDPQTTYKVKIEATWAGKAQTWSWSFTTVGVKRFDATDDAAMTSALGVPSLVSGTVTHGGMIDTATAFLAIADGPKRKLVSVVIPIAVWKQLARDAKPAAFKGRKLEVQSTPRLVGNKFINLAIGSSRQLKFLAK
jgi:hypothetical protein